MSISSAKALDIISKKAMDFRDESHYNFLLDGSIYRGSSGYLKRARKLVHPIDRVSEAKRNGVYFFNGMQIDRINEEPHRHEQLQTMYLSIDKSAAQTARKVWQAENRRYVIEGALGGEPIHLDHFIPRKHSEKQNKLLALEGNEASGLFERGIAIYGTHIPNLVIEMAEAL